VRLLGEGAMGRVYLAHDPTLDRHVAIKVIRKDVLERREAAQIVARFRNEAMAAGRLQHPGIVAVHDFGEDETTSFIVMEYAPGEDLEEYARKYAPLGLAEIGSIMAQLLDALQWAHSFGVIHRDVKPSNLIVSSGRVKITDFGIARISTSRLTQTGTALGTPAYMAPEQYSGAPVDHRADLFSAAVMLYELVTGHRPFAGESIHELAYKICHADAPPLAAHDPSLPPGLQAVVTRALAKDREARYPSAHELATAIAAAISGARSPSRAGAPSWPPAIAQALEVAMAEVMGPLAAPLVRRSLASTMDRNDLLDLLLRGAPDGTDIPALLRRLRAVLEAPALSRSTPTTVGVPAVGEVPARFSPEELDRVTQALVPHVGPIARVLVKKATAQARDFQELCQRLGEHLSTPGERAEFLKKLAGRQV
jgi:serine/threonine-protein kinase